MAHTSKVVKYERLSSGQFAIHTVCCDDPKHTSVHVVAAETVLDKTKLKKSLDFHHALVQQSHEASVKAEAVLKGLVDEDAG